MSPISRNMVSISETEYLIPIYTSRPGKRLSPKVVKLVRSIYMDLINPSDTKMLHGKTQNQNKS